MPVAKSYSHSKHTFAIEITRDNVHELIVWAKWHELDLWEIYDAFILAEKVDSDIYLILETTGFTLIYATQHTIKAFQTMFEDEFANKYRMLEDRSQADQFSHRTKFAFTEIEKI